MNRTNNLEVVCPCCGAQLMIDGSLGKVIAHEAPARHSQAPNLDHAASLLEKDAARREAIFNQSSQDEKIRSRLLERKFEEALKKSKDQPITKPTRDIDLE